MCTLVRSRYRTYLIRKGVLIFNVHYLTLLHSTVSEGAGIEPRTIGDLGIDSQLL
jgi:hypothetical protein